MNNSIEKNVSNNNSKVENELAKNKLNFYELNKIYGYYLDKLDLTDSCGFSFDANKTIDLDVNNSFKEDANNDKKQSKRNSICSLISFDEYSITKNIDIMQDNITFSYIFGNSLFFDEEKDTMSLKSFEDNIETQSFTIDFSSLYSSEDDANSYELTSL